MDESTDAVALTVREPATGVVVVAVAGELDMATVPVAEEVVLRRLRAGVRTLVLDLTGVTFLGSTGINLLITLRNACEGTGTALRLVASSKVVLRPLEVTDLIGQFTVVTAADEAD
jgi:anti-sigma B factor antagonist